MNQKLREQAMADRLGVCLRTLRNWKNARIVPWIKIGRCALYDPQKVEAAILKFERLASV
jgi:hypothetical protein